jgi:hypothetical protein
LLRGDRASALRTTTSACDDPVRAELPIGAHGDTPAQPSPVTGVSPIEDPYWFDKIADYLGPAYWAPDTGRVMAFTA